MMGCSGLTMLVSVIITTIITATTQLTLSSAVAVSSSSWRRVIDVKKGGAAAAAAAAAAEGVVWVVQISDLHFSVFHPERALDFKTLIAPALSLINPSLVLITGDLTDGKSKDLLIMKQNEKEWMEYKSTMDDVIKRSGLDRSIFYDLRGNHDNFGVPVSGGSFDYFSKFSINGQLGRSRKVNSVTLETDKRKHLFVGIDSTMSVGLRGPTNLFGHPTDELLANISTELSQWDSESEKPVTKIAFGHFPISFSAASRSGKHIEDIFLKHSLSAYLCGHLHTRFGKNLKRHHQFSFNSNRMFQLDAQHISSERIHNCSIPAPQIPEFWEWEMGDWRQSRAMRVLAIDRGHVSFIDIDFKSGSRKTIILPTFPLDSRFMLKTSQHKYKCKVDALSYEKIRALIFSVLPVVSVVVRIYDSSPGHLSLVTETAMSKLGPDSSRADLYAAYWNFKAFEDPSAERFWLQIEATDVTGRSSFSVLRPFSINGLNARHSWTWKEFFVMGCQWDALYYPILWISLSVMLIILLVSKAFFVLSKNQYCFNNFSANRSLIHHIVWVLNEYYTIPLLWLGSLGYLFYLVLFPWFFGEVFTGDVERGYMTYKGWTIRTSSVIRGFEFIGSPDVMVIVLPHLLFVVFPAIVVSGALAAERGAYRRQYLALSGKKEDDKDGKCKGPSFHEDQGNERPSLCSAKRWLRIFLLLVSVAICWKHLKSCRALIKAYDMNPFLHSPIYCFAIPVYLAYAAYTTSNF